MPPTTPTTTADLPTFLTRWQPAGGAERSNYALFLTELCDLLHVPRPDPAQPDESKNNYVIDRRITVTHPDGTTSPNYIDLYKRAHFVLETKQGIQKQTQAPPGKARPLASNKAGATSKRKLGHGVRDSKLWDDALLRAKAQAENYVRSIPDDNPPFLLVVDVGYQIETYADFSGLGKTYTPFPNNLSHRFKLTDLADPTRGPGLLSRLQKIWTDPQSLNPAKHAAKVTTEIAKSLAELSKSLEAAKHHPEDVAHFLMRILFTLFAEDVKLIKDDAFTKMLESIKDKPEMFAISAEHVWRDMDKGAPSPLLRQKLLHFNGGLFAETKALPLTGNQLELLIEAATQDWSDVEPAIFGTLLEQALNEKERHELGAHYTPRAYVERLVLPTVIEPLREEWNAAQDKAATLAKKGDKKKAIKTAEAFLYTLCHTTVLDPACGSGNFLYVTLEHMKRLEGEVQDFLKQVDKNYQFPLALPGQTVHPQQLHGLEINPRAAAIADLVIWIGYLQWHFRTHGHTMPPEPVLQKIKNIENRDAVLTYDKKTLARDKSGALLTRWDRTSFKINPVTGGKVPDESKRSPIFEYLNPRTSPWPLADYIVGNPPFIGNKDMVATLTEEYTFSLRKAYPDVPESADFVMYWWHKAAEILRAGKVKRFGFITTNSITQSFNRRVLAHHLSATPPLSLIFAIPDHPWSYSTEGAAVRIAMTVAVVGTSSGILYLLRSETQTDTEEIAVDLEENIGQIHADLKIGANVANAKPLLANADLCGQGMKLVGDFFVDENFPKRTKSPVTGLSVIRNMITPSDVLDGTHGRSVIDFFELTSDQARKIHPEAFQRVIDKVKPLRDQNRRDSIKDLWWRFAWERPVLRNAIKGLPRYFVTLETSKHRYFSSVDSDDLWDGSLFAVALDDYFYAGILGSRIHGLWALRTGGFLGPTPRYNRTQSFEAFPFPDCTEKKKSRIRQIAEELDAHRKRQQAKHPDLTLTDMYNILEKLRAADRGEISAAQFSPKDKTIHDHGLISILKQLHDDLDAAVFDAYGWSDGKTLTDEQLLEKLVALNHQRAAEEKRGIIKYLRPDFQNPPLPKP